MKCPECGRFIKDVVANINELTDEIEEVEGICSKHGKVNPTDWECEDFYPWPKVDQ